MVCRSVFPEAVLTLGSAQYLEKTGVHYAYVHTYIYIFTYIYIYTCVYIYMWRYVYRDRYTYVYI